MQAQGSLSETNLATLLQTMQSERATGTLSVESTEQCSLYFLFGHLFHASGAGGQGEEVVIRALGWSHGSFRFDPRAKLPAEETIKSPPADLINRAERRRREAAAAGAGAAAPAPLSEPAPRRETVPRPEPAPRVEPSPRVQPAAAPVPRPAPQPAAPYVPPQERPEPRWERPALPVPERQVETFRPAVAPAPAATSAPVPVPATAPEPEREPVMARVDSPWAPREPQSLSRPFPSPADRPVGGAPDAAPLDTLYPLPAGKKQYEGLKSSFVDFPKLLRTLKSDRHTGYVRLQGNGYSGSLLMHEGELLEALSSNGGISEGEPAFLHFRRRMDEGSGLIDVIELPPDTVVALAQLLTARPLFTGLLGRFVDFNALLDYLAEERVDGSVVVDGGRETGVILLRDGQVLGAYTASARQLDTKTNLVASLAKEPPARIEVKSGATEVERMDFEASLNQPY